MRYHHVLSAHFINVRITAMHGLSIVKRMLTIRITNSQVPEPIPPRRRSVDPHGYREPATWKDSISKWIDDNSAGLPAQNICPDFASMYPADIHLLLTRSVIAHYAGEAVGPVPCACARPADAMSMIKVVVLLAVGIELTPQTKIRQFAPTRRATWLVAFNAVEITVEDAGIALAAEENQSICEGFEKRFDGRFEGLVRLGVMIPVRLATKKHYLCWRSPTSQTSNAS